MRNQEYIVLPSLAEAEGIHNQGPYQVLFFF
jgi:hypothetical protein